MSQKVYNTKTRRKEVLHPLREGAIGMYVCGITAYDVCHIGHARAAVVFDVIYRHLRARGYQVTYVKNFTDIDDKIIERANREGVTTQQLSERYISLHDEDMAALNVLTPTVTPKATEHMEEMISMIRILQDKGIAYEVDGDVFFGVGRYPAYGGLSGRKLDEWWPERAWTSTIKKGIRWTSCCGKRARKASHPGRVPGGRAGQAGTSSVRR